MNDITLGKYFPGKSFIHRLDPRTKILATILYIVAVFMVTELVFFIPVALFICLTVALSKLPAKCMLQSLKPLKWIILMMFIINIFMVKTGTTLLHWWILTITDEGIVRAVFIIIRLVLLIAGTSVMTLTTMPIALTDGIESLLAPLKKIKFPVHELAMMMTIALRFIPTLLDETDRIMKAQLARGADFESGNLLKRAKAMIPILIPLFVSAFMRADELALAMDSRCYHGGDGRTRMKIMKMLPADWCSLACTVLLCVALGLLPVLFKV